MDGFCYFKRGLHGLPDFPQYSVKQHNNRLPNASLAGGQNYGFKGKQETQSHCDFFRQGTTKMIDSTYI